MLEIEISYIRENLPGKMTSIIEKTGNIDKRISKNYINNLLAKKVASNNTYQKGSMDEKLIQKFLEKQKIKEQEEKNLLEETTKIEESKTESKEDE